MIDAQNRSCLLQEHGFTMTLHFGARHQWIGLLGFHQEQGRCQISNHSFNGLFLHFHHEVNCTDFSHLGIIWNAALLIIQFYYCF